MYEWRQQLWRYILTFWCQIIDQFEWLNIFDVQTKFFFKARASFDKVTEN